MSLICSIRGSDSSDSAAGETISWETSQTPLPTVSTTSPTLASLPAYEPAWMIGRPAWLALV